MRLFLAAIIGLAIVAAPAAAQAATPTQATQRIARCLKTQARALRVVQHGGSKGGKAYFTRPFNAYSTHYLQWGGYYTIDGQVRGTITSSVGLTGRQKRAANRCLKPFNGHV
jgi:hypothetical protein